MRGRRNTNLSTSSTSSSSDVVSASSSPLLSTDEKTLSEDLESGIPVSRKTRIPHRSNSFTFYRIASIACILVFIGVHDLLTRSCGRHTNGTIFDHERRPIALPINVTHPERIGFIDNYGVSRWTISLPEDSEIPLPARVYNDICGPSDQQHPAQKSWPSNFVDLARTAVMNSPYLDPIDAQAAGILPPSSRNTSDGTCKSSLTFSMDASEASFGKTLLLLWLSYGIAVSEGRAFFVDDSNWAYGKLDAYFSNIPKPSCQPPSPSHILPCPQEAKHLLVSAATAQWSLQPRLNALSRRSWMRSVDSNRKIFDLLRKGYEAFFSVADDDKSYAASRIASLRLDASAHRHPLVGMQIRRGDMHPLEPQFSQDYLPLDRYTNAAKHLLHDPTGNTTASILLASDDPDLINTPELSLAAAPLHIQRTQDRIQLATKAALDRASPAEPIREPGSAYVKHVDENAGWDGGFYSSLFFSLGKSTSHGQRSHESMTPSNETMRMREYVARAFLLDLDILSHADGVVCAVSSAACRVLGVMMGWHAIQHGRWVNVDDGLSWSWDASK